jgi:hypothetical protein
MAHSPTPDQVHDGKNKIDAGRRVVDPLHRPWFCRSCGCEYAPGRHVPPGWYSVARHTGDETRPTIRLGVFCSVACLADQLPRLEGVEREASLSDVARSAYTHQRG